MAGGEGADHAMVMCVCFTCILLFHHPQVKAHGAVGKLVVDPVMVSTSGHALADGSVGAALLHTLFPLAALVTPNIPEASALLGGFEGLCR